MNVAALSKLVCATRTLSRVTQPVGIYNTRSRVLHELRLLRIGDISRHPLAHRGGERAHIQRQPPEPSAWFGSIGRPCGLCYRPRQSNGCPTDDVSLPECSYPSTQCRMWRYETHDKAERFSSVKNMSLKRSTKFTFRTTTRWRMNVKVVLVDVREYYLSITYTGV